MTQMAWSEVTFWSDILNFREHYAPCACLVLHLCLPPSLPASALEQCTESQPAVDFIMAVSKEMCVLSWTLLIQMWYFTVNTVGFVWNCKYNIGLRHIWRESSTVNRKQQMRCWCWGVLKFSDSEKKKQCTSVEWTVSTLFLIWFLTTWCSHEHAGCENHHIPSVICPFLFMSMWNAFYCWYKQQGSRRSKMHSVICACICPYLIT